MNDTLTIPQAPAPISIAAMVSKAPVVPPPEWMVKIVRRQIKHNKRYETAFALFATSYNRFIEEIGEINNEFDTAFTFEQAVTMWQGSLSAEGLEYDDDEDGDE